VYLPGLPAQQRSESDMSDQFETHARTVTLLTLISRVTGLARDATLSRVFGAGAIMDAFWFAFMIPNLFRRLFGEGALSAAFLPVYSRLAHRDAELSRRLATLTIALMVIFLGGLTIVGEIVLAIISLMPDQGHGHLALRLMMIMLPYMPMICIVAILGAMLQVHGRFGPTAAAPIILNVALIAAAAGLAPLLSNHDGAGQTRHVAVVACAVIAAGLAQVVWSLAALRGSGWWVRDSKSLAPALAPFRQILHNASPMLLGMGVLQLNTFLDGVIASYPTTFGPTIFGVAFPLDQGALASLSFAQRLYEFPLGVFGIAVATAIFPALSRAHDDDERFAATLRRGLRLVIFRGLPASAGLMLVSHPLTATVFQGGDFTAADTDRVSFILMGYAPAIWAYSTMHVLTRAFYARGNSKTPMKVAMAMVALNFVLNCTLIWTPLKEAGLAWSTAICAIVQVIVLMSLLRKRVGHIVDRALIFSWLKSAIVTAVMAAGVWLARIEIHHLARNGSQWSGAVIELSVLVAVGVTIGLAAAALLRMPELSWALGRAGGSPRTGTG
jgi:putative peptidoglycan lipid II flippase